MEQDSKYMYDSIYYQLLSRARACRRLLIYQNDFFSFTQQYQTKQTYESE